MVKKALAPPITLSDGWGHNAKARLCTALGAGEAGRGERSPSGGVAER